MFLGSEASHLLVVAWPKGGVSPAPVIRPWQRDVFDATVRTSLSYLAASIILAATDRRQISCTAKLWFLSMA